MDRFVARSGPRLAAMLALLGALALAAVVAPACGSSHSTQPVEANGGDGGPTTVAPDAGPTPVPTPTPTPTAGAGVPFGTQGPWPVENRTFGAADGIDASPVIAVSTDEAQNIWVATPLALFVMKPGDTKFTKFTSRDGLHLADNPVLYHENYCGSTATLPGAATPRGISTIVGGAPNEVFVGYWGADEGSGQCPPLNPAENPDDRHSGKTDRVRLGADGKLTVDRFDYHSIVHGMQFWHNRTVLRMVYDHQVNAHTLYVATNHGVNMILPDKYRLPNPGEFIDLADREWMGDHLHVTPCFPSACPTGVGQEGPLKIGWWRGLALSSDGQVWHAGRWAAGKIRPTAPLDPVAWISRTGAQAFSEGFGDPYPGNPPVFQPTSCDYGPQATCTPMEGLVVSLTAVTEAPDGFAWFASGKVFGHGAGVLGIDEPTSYFGIAKFKRGLGFKYLSYASVGLTEDNVQDMVALPNGQIVLAGGSTGLVFFDPATGKHVAMRAGQGIPNDEVIQLEVDAMVNPPTLHVATAGGAAALRVFPTIQ
jgi:hypothetical protein